MRVEGGDLCSVRFGFCCCLYSICAREFGGCISFFRPLVPITIYRSAGWLGGGGGGKTDVCFAVAFLVCFATSFTYIPTPSVPLLTSCTLLCARRVVVRDVSGDWCSISCPNVVHGRHILHWRLAPHQMYHLILLHVLQAAALPCCLGDVHATNQAASR